MDPTPDQFKELQDRYGFLPNHGVQFPLPGSSISLPPSGKLGVHRKVFDAGFRLPITDFQRDILMQYGANVQFLSPNAVNKMVGFEMLCRALGFLSDVRLFKHFFKFSSSGHLYNFSCRPEITSVITGRLSLPRDWSDEWLWVNSDLLCGGYVRRHREPDGAPILWGDDQRHAVNLAA